jgi:toxin ParE1/3/4
LNLPGLQSWPLNAYPFLLFCMECREHIDVWRLLHAYHDIPAWMKESGNG